MKFKYISIYKVLRIVCLAIVEAQILTVFRVVSRSLLSVVIA